MVTTYFAVIIPDDTVTLGFAVSDSRFAIGLSRLAMFSGPGGLVRGRAAAARSSSVGTPRPVRLWGYPEAGPWAALVRVYDGCAGRLTGSNEEKTGWTGKKDEKADGANGRKENRDVMILPAQRSTRGAGIMRCEG